MKPGAVLLIAVLCSASARAEPDPWLSQDKALHFSASSLIAIGTYATSSAFVETPRARLVYGASVTLLAGLGKELWDSSGYGDGSWRDFTWDLIGAAVGLAICWAVDTLVLPLFARAPAR